MKPLLARNNGGHPLSISPFFFLISLVLVLFYHSVPPSCNHSSSSFPLFFHLFFIYLVYHPPSPNHFPSQSFVFYFLLSSTYSLHRWYNLNKSPPLSFTPFFPLFLAVILKDAVLFYGMQTEDKHQEEIPVFLLKISLSSSRAVLCCLFSPFSSSKDFFLWTSYQPL